MKNKFQNRIKLKKKIKISKMNYKTTFKKLKSLTVYYIYINFRNYF